METHRTTPESNPLPEPPPQPAPDLAAAKTRSRATWSAGDYAVIGTTLQIVGEALAEAADVRSGERVLDVACGNGNAALAAARRFAQVTAIDYVPALLDGARGRGRGRAAGPRAARGRRRGAALPGRRLRRRSSPRSA